MEAKDMFLAKVNKRIDEGEFDEKLNLPFTSRKLLKIAIEDKVTKRAAADKTPVLTDAEIKVVLDEVREAGASTFHLFEKYGFWETDEDGALKISKKGIIALKHSSLI